MEKHSVPLIALLTDFGTRDHYVGAMKGVALSVCPGVALIDIAHDLPAHDVTRAALELAGAYRYFPPGTIFLVVVDPGVGSARRGLAAEAGEWRFVAPDNGVLTAVFQATPPARVVELSERRYARPTVSRTFEGRDRFAPAAAWLARGTQLSALGRPVNDYVTLPLAVPARTADGVRGAVVRIDRFGNVITNLDRATVEALAASGELVIALRSHAIARLVSTYADIPPGEVGALFGSTDALELAVQSGSAAERLGAAVGDAVTVRTAPKP